MSLESIILEKREGIAKITLNRPKALNALSEQIFSEIAATLEDIGKDESVGVVIITGRAVLSLQGGISRICVSVEQEKGEVRVLKRRCWPGRPSKQ